MPLNKYSTSVQVLLVLVVILASAVGPVAASPDDGLLDGDGETGNTSDVVGDTVNSTTEQVGSTADAVGETTGTTDATESVSDTVSETTEAGSETTDAATSAGDVTGEATDATAAAEATDAETTAAGDALERGIGTGVLPINSLPVEQVPGTGDAAPIEPEDSPYGSEAEGRLDACAFPVRSDDLPLEQAPGPADLPVKLNVPGVPVGLLTPEVVADLAFSFAPAPCEVYDPHDPSVDPTEPPSDPWAVAELSDVTAGPDGLRVAGGSRGLLEEGGVGGVGLAGVVANPKQVSGGERLKLTDGRTSRYLYLEGIGTVLVEKRVVDGDLVIGVLGSTVAVQAQCELQNPSAPSAENPTGPCTYEATGLPPYVTAGQIIETVRNPPTEPPVEPRQD
jgi:hypothetical protein